ncbi:MAG: hypothetical protein ICV66_04370 [Chitinophagaceae bacterium]|nr:hypothetical protein [Chitinophagaceae bacterium]
MPRISNLKLLRTAAVIATLIGAIGSLYFMFHADRNQKSILLIILFTGWVLSPVLGLLLTSKISRQWTVPTQTFLHWLMMIMSVVLLIAYSGALTPNAKPAFIFLVAPFALWIIITAVFLAARKAQQTRKLHDTKENT